MGALLVVVLGLLLSMGLGSGLARADDPDFPPGYPRIGQSSESRGGLYLATRDSRVATTLFPLYVGPGSSPQQYAYCVEYTVGAQYGIPGNVGGWDDFPGGNNFSTSREARERAAWIVYNSYPQVDLAEFRARIGAPSLTAEEAITGTQAAIWHFTDDVEYLGLRPDRNGPADTTSASAQRVARVRSYLIQNNTGRPETTGPSISLSMPTGTQEAGTRVGPIVIEASEPTVAVNLQSEYPLVDANGRAVNLGAAPTGVQLFLDVPADADAGEARLDVEVTGPVTTGMLVSNTKPRTQTLMIARSDKTTRSDSGKVKWQAKPQIGTTAEDAADGDDYLDPEGEVTVRDTVSYTGLKPGTEYRVEGELMLRGADGEAIPTGITASQSFTPESPAGSVELSFTIPAGELQGETIVVFEELYQGKVQVAIHADIDDENQTVYRPRIGTSAVDGVDSDNLLAETGEVVVVDTVAYEGLRAGETYTMRGELMTRGADGEPVPSGITQELTFTPERSDGTVELSFTIPDGALRGEIVVVFERLHLGDLLVAAHTDIDDEFQTVYRPRIGTTARDGADGDDHLDPEGEVTVVDTVSYTGLEPGHEYTIEGELMLRGADGEAIPTGITASHAFTPESPSGSVELSFTVPAGELQGETIVVFEELYRGEVQVAIHADIQDEAQSVYRPRVGTSATDGVDGDQFLPEHGEAVVVDTVAYEGLRVGETYTIEGELMVRDGGEGRPTGITSSVTFVPEQASGTVDVSFTIPEGELLGSVVVVFERLYLDGTEVAAHADIEDEGQTVYRPRIDTYAYDLRTGEKLLDPNGAVLRDDLSYAGLQPGRTYVARGEVMLHETGVSTGITGETEFVAEEPDGVVHVDFEIPEGYADETLVVFEWLYLGAPDEEAEASIGDQQMAEPADALPGELLLATHTDLDAESQTVQVGPPPLVPPVVPPTEPPPSVPPHSEPPPSVPPAAVPAGVPSAPVTAPKPGLPSTGGPGDVTSGIAALAVLLLGAGVVIRRRMLV